MELDIIHQVYQAGTALLLGLAAGLYYDILKTIRCCKKRTAGGTIFFDLLFWLGLAIALFFQTMTTGRGVVRIFMLVTNALGAWLYFLALSKAVLFLLGKMLCFLWIMASPICKIWAKGKNIAKKGEGGFKNWVKCYIIKKIHLHNTKSPMRKKEGQGEWVAEKSKYIYKTGSVGFGCLRRVQSDRSARTDRERKRGRGRPGRSRGRAGVGERGLRNRDRNQFGPGDH